MAHWNPLGRPVWALGFRPFFLYGVLWSTLVMLYWVSVQMGAGFGVPYFDPITWHVHEMVFGFAVAIISGFVMTASQNWTGIPGIKGRKLMALAALWGAGRLLPFALGPEPSVIYAVVDLAYMPALGIALSPYLLAPGQRHNAGFYGFFSALFVSNLLMHLVAFDVVSWEWRRPAQLLGVHAVILVISLIGGRVIPFFTSRAVPGARISRWPAVDTASHVTAAAFLIVSFVTAGAGSIAAVAGLIAGLTHAARWLGWRPWQTRKVPVLWVLHAGYFFVWVGFVLSALAALGKIPPSPGSHAFTAGAIGVLIHGMIARVALGHSGRPIRPDRATVLGFYLVVVSAVVRVFLPLVSPQEYHLAILVSGIFWLAAFGLLLARYERILISPRADGMPG